MYNENYLTFSKKKLIIYCFIKRLIDITVAFIAILLLLIFFVIIAIAIKITSKGPIFFIDKRIGRDKEINIYKFRTMYIDSESNIEKYLSKEQLLQWKKERKLDNDPRITRIGKLLRRTSLDEIPQLFNILSGSISLIGPRPITKMELQENYNEADQSVLLIAKP